MIELIIDRILIRVNFITFRIRSERELISLVPIESIQGADQI